MSPRRVSFGMDLRPNLTEAQLAARRISIRCAQQVPVLGERNGSAKLTAKQVKKIRELRAAGERPSVLAQRFAVHRTLIWHIVTRRIWGHV